jgi:hypothetical protein
MPAFIAAWPIRPCLLISSISFLTWASLTALIGRVSLDFPARARNGIQPWRWGDLIVVAGEM